MLVRVLDHDDGCIDHGTDGDSDTAEAHDVRRDAERPHADVGNEYAERQRDDSDERAARVQQEDEAHERDDGAFLEQRDLERRNRAMDEVGAVVDRNDLRAFGQAALDLGESLLDAADHR